MRTRATSRPTIRPVVDSPTSETRDGKPNALRRRIAELERWFKLHDGQIRVLERERQKLAALVNHIDATYLVLNRDLRVVWTNRANDGFQWCGNRNGDAPSGTVPNAIGRSCAEVLCQEGEQCSNCPCAVSFRSATVVHLESVQRDREGRTRCFYITAMPIKSLEGPIDEVIVMVQDITDLEVLRKSQERLLAALDVAEAASRAKSEFVANVSHEIRTPMNGVIGMTELLLGTQLSEEQRECLQIVHDSSVGLLTIINDILDFSKIEAGRMELEHVDFDLLEAVEAAARLVRSQCQQKGLAFECRLDPRLPERGRGDSTRLRQVLLNLAGNAVKFTSEGGVSIRVELIEETETATVIRFVIEDTGIGIPADKVAGLFEPFSQVDASTTRKYGGTGLGLAISKRLAEMMGGTIKVESRMGSGSTFSFTTSVDRSLSLTPGASRTVSSLSSDANRTDFTRSAEFGSVSASPSSTTEEQRAAFWRKSASDDGEVRGPEGPLNVLLAEDNHVNRRVARAMLITLGCDAHCVADGREAVEAATSGSYDLILMDCQMPEMDGLEATRRIRASELDGKHVTIVALTANAMTGDRERCLEAGMDDYLTKPVRRNDLAEMLKRWAA